ncbi:putative Na+/H+ antiporter [Desulfobulbus rhabdoformis]|uniref:putative Na+/H+ antiporter n=1 Tax=Desulfobulbus rhabdoformis TaxID=34032 RepID=UPI001962ECFA|nr:putative Na+/H+ antiporter [Desulfobulbus rhabdoformis]MBM9614131.1 putative Na+/H+ antiporter [Desulfobulbus rhabdoformis]
MKKQTLFLLLLLCILAAATVFAAGSGQPAKGATNFPPNFASYADGNLENVWSILWHRIQQTPFNLVATLIFFAAIIHTFLSSKFLSYAHTWKAEHQKKIEAGHVSERSTHIPAEIFHFLGEVEVVFGLWAVVLCGSVVVCYDWNTFIHYVSGVNYTEPMFVVVIMTLASSRPILKLSEKVMARFASVFQGTLAAWWLTIMTLGPILGSFITEPAAMTISAMLLARKFYELNPSHRFKYATIALLFVNISVGGTLTHFAAPPVLMVAAPWDWGLPFMLTNFGWKAIIGIIISNALVFALFWKEINLLENKFNLTQLKQEIREKYIQRDDLRQDLQSAQERIGEGLQKEIEHIKNAARESTMDVCDELDESFCVLLEETFEQEFEDLKIQQMSITVPGLLPRDKRPKLSDPNWDNRCGEVPGWIMAVHVAFMIWVIMNAHYPTLFVAGLLFFVGFSHVTWPFQNNINFKPPMLVGFFLGGLVIHGGLQGWWIEPVLGSLGEIPLMLSAAVLTAFNDNAAITYLSTLVPGFTESLKYAVVAGAVTGGGLTVIANAPNPAGQALLKNYFSNGISPLRLLGYALLPTIIMGLCFFFL